MALRYEFGELKLAETRGDGINFGEDVTENAKVIRDVKKKLKDSPEYLEVRGEVYMTNADFDAVNKMQELSGKKAFANPRNCAAGTLRQLDPSITKERKLSMFVFNIQQTRGIAFETHTQGYEFLKKFSLTTIIEQKKSEDGQVYTDLQLQLALGELNEGVTNLELTAAYAAIAGRGVYRKPAFYTKIIDRYGNVLLENEREPKRILKESTAWLLALSGLEISSLSSSMSWMFWCRRFMCLRKCFL